MIMPKNKKDIIERLQVLQKEKEAIALHKRIAEIENELYKMDVEALNYEVEKGIRTQESAEKELVIRRNKYFG